MFILTHWDQETHICASKLTIIGSDNGLSPGRHQRNMFVLTNWDRMTYICVSKLTIIDSDNGLSPGRHQAVIWTNDGLLWMRTLGTNFSEILSEIHPFSLKRHLKMSSAKWRQLSLGLNVLRVWLFEARWCLHASANWISISLVNGLSPFRYNANI